MVAIKQKAMAISHRKLSFALLIVFMMAVGTIGQEFYIRKFSGGLRFKRDDNESGHRNPKQKGRGESVSSDSSSKGSAMMSKGSSNDRLCGGKMYGGRMHGTKSSKGSKSVDCSEVRRG